MTVGDVMMSIAKEPHYVARFLWLIGDQINLIPLYINDSLNLVEKLLAGYLSVDIKNICSESHTQE